MWFQKAASPPAPAKPTATCQECGLVFDPSYAPEPFKHLCPEHHKGPMEIARKKAEVREWAERHFERLFEEAAKENAERRAEQAKQEAEYRKSMAQAYAAAYAYHGGYGRQQMGGCGGNGLFPW